jgi:signal peptidase II
MIFIIFADQLTKWLCVALLEGTQSVYLIPDVLRLTYVENRGAAFGMLDEHRWVFLLLSTVAIIGLFIFLAKKPPESRLAWAGFTLVIGGGVGNMIDRVMLGYVIDFIDFCAFPNLWKWVFNIADACVCVGVGILMLWLILDMVKEYKQEKREKQEKTNIAQGENNEKEEV